MPIKVEIYPPLRRFIGQKAVEVDGQMDTVEKLLDYLTKRYNKGFRKEVIEGMQDYSYLVTVNGRPTWDLSTTLSDGDVVTISAHFAGE
ncbi:MAG: MoaD/ThiS family protein [Chloroflexi bacterium]|nr:MoaD/ThiS family protein [Chloroflexota bacterium]